jgi:two-component system response regulator GlrR
MPRPSSVRARLPGRLLKLTDGNVADAARLADRNRTEFYRLLQKHELTPGHFKADVVAPPASLSPTSDAPKSLIS